MKNLKLSFVAIIGLLTFISCDKGEMGPVVSTQPGTPAITAPAPGQSYILTEESAGDTLLIFEWSEPNYGFPAATTYKIEMGTSPGSFADSVEIGSTTETSYAVTVSGMNNRLLSAGVPANQQATLPIRVRAFIDDSVQEKVSEPASYTFTPYLIEIEYPEIYVPGSYQSASGYTNDWSPADAPPLFSVNDDGKYEGYVYMANSGNQFKFTDERNWDVNWGDDGADGTIEPNGANIEAAAAGYYKVNVDLNTMTYSMLNTQWGLIGSATPNGWDSDQDMTYNPETKAWKITLDLTAGEIKFRANDAWDLNYGDEEGDTTLEAGAANIPVDEAGNYTVTLNLSTAPYTYSLTKN